MTESINYVPRVGDIVKIADAQGLSRHHELWTYSGPILVRVLPPDASIIDDPSHFIGRPIDSPPTDCKTWNGVDNWYYHVNEVVEVLTALPPRFKRVKEGVRIGKPVFQI